MPAPSSGTTATIVVTAPPQAVTATGITYRYQTSITNGGTYHLDGSVPDSDYWCGNEYQLCLQVRGIAGGNAIQLFPPFTYQNSGIYTTTATLQRHYGVSDLWYANVSNVDTYVGKMATVSGNVPYLSFSAPFSAQSLISTYNGMSASAPVINVNTGYNSVTLTGNVTATTTGTIILDTLTTLHVCNGATVYSLTLPSGFNGVAAITPRANSCVDQLYQAFTSSFDPVGGPTSLPSLYSAATVPLPTCAAGMQGFSLTVTDATSPTYMGALTSGGGITTAVICSYNGSTYAWLTH